MARKTLLNEQEIRKFLKLANITTVGDQQIQEMGGIGDATDELDEEAPPEEMAMEPEEDMGDEPGEEMELSVDDDPELEDDDLGSDLDVTDKEELMADVVRAVADALGIADRVDVEAGEGEAEDELAMDAPDDLGAEMPEPELDVPDEGGDELDLGAPEEEEPMMETEEELSEDDIVSEVARRVAARLSAQNEKEKLVDTLAERILSRLTK